MRDAPFSLREEATITDASERSQIIEYIRDMTQELSELADRAQCAPLGDALREVSRTAQAL